MAPSDVAINRLCRNNQTRHAAKDLYSTAFHRTRKGTGRELDAGHALPAICAFLASEKSGRGEVTLEEAGASVSMEPKTFEAAVQRVRDVLPTSSEALKPTQVTCHSLVLQYSIREDAGVAMAEAAEALKKSNALDSMQLGVEQPVVQCALFHWVCTKAFDLKVPDFQVYDAQHLLSRREWAFALRMLDEHCGHMLAGFVANAKTAVQALQTRSQTRARLAPATNNKNPLLDITPNKKGYVGGMKRKTRPDAKENETPSKRPKASPLVTPKRAREGAPPEVVQDDSENEATETILVQKPRQPDTSAWEAQRPQPNTTPAQTPASKTAISNANRPVTSPVQTPSAKTTISNVNDIINATPMTSTGMSDVFSDPSSSARPPLHFRIPSPSTSDDEMPRLRRRNLRAPFLDQGAYCWRPDARTKARLERARKWEALMISQYGDPWNA